MAEPENTDPEVVAHSDDTEDAPCLFSHSGSCTGDAADFGFGKLAGHNRPADSQLMHKFHAERLGESHLR